MLNVGLTCPLDLILLLLPKDEPSARLEDKETCELDMVAVHRLSDPSMEILFMVEILL